MGCSRRTVSRGAQEGSQLSGAEVERRIRRPGAGRQSYQEPCPEIDDAFVQGLPDHTAGDPMDDQVRWTDLTLGQIAELLYPDHGIPVSKFGVRQLLRPHHYRRRKAHKRQTRKAVKHRQEHFANIQRLKDE